MTNAQTKTTTTLTREDIRDLLAGFAGAIELDQIRADALPSEISHAAYNGSLWRSYRQDHLDFINQVLPTVNVIRLRCSKNWPGWRSRMRRELSGKR
jgi:hypothetical protein